MKMTGRSRTKALWLSLLASVFILSALGDMDARGEDMILQATFYVH